MCACVWPCELSTAGVFGSGYGSWSEQRSGEPLAQLTLAETGVEQISSPHSPSWRGGGDKGLFPNATAAEGGIGGWCRAGRRL